MIFTLKNDRLNIAVSELGAELQSITASSGVKEEFLWNGDDNVWSGRAPVLFPIVGALKESQMKIGGKTYPLPRHGFARTSTFTCVKNEPQQLLFRLQSDTDTLAVYPWNFILDIGYTLSDNRVDVGYTVQHQNSHSNDSMLFTIGSHPAFALPLNTAPIDQFAIRFSDTENLQHYPLDAQGLLSVAGEPFSLDSKVLILNETTFDNDALVFKDINSKSISLWQGDMERIKVNTGDAPHLGIWAKPGAAFVCIEPWFGYSDTENATGYFHDKPELISLSAGESFQTNWSIELPSV